MAGTYIETRAVYCLAVKGVGGKGGSKRTFGGSTTLLIYQLDSGALRTARGVEVVVWEPHEKGGGVEEWRPSAIVH